MIQLSFNNGPAMIVGIDEIVRVLLPGDRFERRRGCDLVVTYRKSEDEAASLGAEAGVLGASVRMDRLELGDPRLN